MDWRGWSDLRSKTQHNSGKCNINRWHILSHSWRFQWKLPRDVGGIECLVAVRTNNSCWSPIEHYANQWDWPRCCISNWVIRKFENHTHNLELVWTSITLIYVRIIFWRVIIFNGLVKDSRKSSVGLFRRIKDNYFQKRNYLRERRYRIFQWSNEPQ